MESDQRAHLRIVVLLSLNLHVILSYNQRGAGETRKIDTGTIVPRCCWLVM